MKTLIRKEFVSICCSGSGFIFALTFLFCNGVMLWVFEGRYNILDAGYASLDSFFTLAPLFLLVLIPALTMRSFAEEKRSGTFNLLLSRPLRLSTIWLSKWISAAIFILLVILSTIIYLCTLYFLGAPKGNIDIGASIISYFSLILISWVFLSIGLFSSCISKNQILAFIVALFLNIVFYYGFDLISTFSSVGKVQVFISSLGLHSHYHLMQQGAFELRDILVLLIYITLFFSASISILSIDNRRNKYYLLTLACILVLILTNILTPFIQFDFTKDKKYTISNYSKGIMKDLSENKSKAISINVYLNDNLNPGFQRLRDAVRNLLSELNRYADYNINISFIDPTTLPVGKEDRSVYMAKQGMPAITLNEVDRNNKISQQIIYPYAQIISDHDTIPVSLLKNIGGNSAEENLNASIENLEFQFIDALHVISRKDTVNIAFIEGHGELSRSYVYDAEEILAKYFFVNRGQIGYDVTVLDNFKVVIIAGPTQKYSESEKYILDQYLMKGGRILWLIDGAIVSHQELTLNGQSPSMKNETNLDDLLFSYGVRIEPDLLQDAQCSSILLNADKNTQPIAVPWYYSPLLLPSRNSIITKNIANVKAEFVSSINLTNNSKGLIKNVLLTTSEHSHIIRVPEMIDFNIQNIQSASHYFNQSFLTTAISLEGQFTSAFENRSIPDSLISNNQKNITQSQNTKMIVASSSDIIRNGIISNKDKSSQIVPMGYDRLSNKLYGNRDFIINAVNWLADDGYFMQLRKKSHDLNLLNKKEIIDHRYQYALFNTLFPISIICLILSAIYLVRKGKYTK